MIIIGNISKQVRLMGEHEYVVMINKKPICEFTHRRENGLAECLRKAADAVEEEQRTHRYRSSS